MNTDTSPEGDSMDFWHSFVLRFQQDVASRSTDSHLQPHLIYISMSVTLT